MFTNGTRSAGKQQQMTDVLPSIWVQIYAIIEPQVGSVLTALPRSITMRTIEAEIVKPPKAKMEIKPVI